MRTKSQELAQFGRGIGNHARFEIVEALIHGPRTVSELVKIVGLSQSAVSQHLAKLKKCRLVKDERHGQEVSYTFNSWHVLGMLTTLMYSIKKHHKSAKVSK